MQHFAFHTLIICLFSFSPCFAQDYITEKTVTGKAKKMYERGIQLSFNSHLEAALEDFEKALDIEPTFIDAQIHWANVQYDLGNLELAEEGFVTLAFDFRNFGESEGEPRFFESPVLKKVDVENDIPVEASRKKAIHSYRELLVDEDQEEYWEQWFLLNRM